MLKYRVIPVTTDDYRRLAEKRLPRFLFDYIDGGSGEELSLERNRTDLQEIRLQQRVMRDVGNIETHTELMGQDASMPVALAPVGLAGMYRRRGEAQAARAAARSGLPFATSTVGICSVEEVQEAAGGQAWFQLYMMRDRGLVDAMLARAEQAGCKTLVFTVDLPVTGKRYRDDRKGIFGGGLKAKAAKAWQLASRPAWVWDVGIRGRPHDFGNLTGVVEDMRDFEAFRSFIDTQFDPTVTWKDIEVLRRNWNGKLLVKGIMSGEDAISAFDAGADGVVVSNHGGRQIDGVASSISRLPEVVRAAGERGEIFLDSGVRNGADVIRAVALGARGVLMGRAWAYAVAARGERGVFDLLRVIREEMASSMALMGVNRVDELNPDLVDTRNL